MHVNRCRTCRKRKTRCDGKRPLCSTCTDNGHECMGFPDGADVTLKRERKDDIALRRHIDDHDGEEDDERMFVGGIDRKQNGQGHVKRCSTGNHTMGSSRLRKEDPRTHNYMDNSSSNGSPPKTGNMSGGGRAKMEYRDTAVLPDEGRSPVGMLSQFRDALS